MRSRAGSALADDFITRSAPCQTGAMCSLRDGSVTLNIHIRLTNTPFTHPHSKAAPWKGHCRVFGLDKTTKVETQERKANRLMQFRRAWDCSRFPFSNFGPSGRTSSTLGFPPSTNSLVLGNNFGAIPPSGFTITYHDGGVWACHILVSACCVMAQWLVRRDFYGHCRLIRAAITRGFSLRRRSNRCVRKCSGCGRIFYA